MSKALETHERVEALVEKGASQAQAFRQVAEETGVKVNSVRGAFYGAARAQGKTPARTRRRETTPQDALNDARAALERAIAAIDREVEVAEERAAEANGEAKSLKASAAERKQAIQVRLKALQ